MDSEEQKAITSKLHSIISEWTTRYIYQIFFVDYEEPVYKYYCEISRPENLQPIPQAKCKIFFDIKKDHDNYTINFHFESDSLIHSWDEMTLRHDAFEVLLLMTAKNWIEKMIEMKLRVKSELYLGTSFESTRVIDVSSHKSI